jgi:hypothetical protein
LPDAKGAAPAGAFLRQPERALNLRTSLPGQFVRRMLRKRRKTREQDLETRHRLRPVSAGGVDTSRPARLILHIGLHKTGSTSIQTALRQAGEGLRAKGVLFPSGVFGDRQHSLLTRVISKGSATEAAAFFLSLRELANREKCGAVILSGEQLSVMRRPDIEKMRAGIEAANFDPLVVAFTRPKPALYRSRISQRMLAVRESFVTPYSFWRSIAHYDPDAICARFTTVFGTERVVRHHLAGAEDAVQVFAATAGIDLPQVARRNVGTDFAVMSLINAVKADFDLSSTNIHSSYRAAFGDERHRFTGERRFLNEMLEHQDQAARTEFARELKVVNEDSVTWTREEQLRYLRKLEKFIGYLRRNHAFTREGRVKARRGKRQKVLAQLRNWGREGG